MKNERAFPSTVQYFPGDTNYHDEQGMTLRDYFAAKAMQPMVNEYDNLAWLAKYAYEIADAMLKAREEKGGGGKEWPRY